MLATGARHRGQPRRESDRVCIPRRPVPLPDWEKRPSGVARRSRAATDASWLAPGKGWPELPLLNVLIQRKSPRRKAQKRAAVGEMIDGLPQWKQRRVGVDQAVQH